MTISGANANLKRILELVKNLGEEEIRIVRRVVEALSIKFTKQFTLDGSEYVDEKVTASLGNTIRLHHLFSREPFSKDKFEHALESAELFSGKKADLAPRGNPGHDITIGEKKVSLKTQADSQIKEDKINISKLMELGTGEWTDKVEQLEAFRDAFLEHLNHYETILVLRCLSKENNKYYYELIEIPLSLLRKARKGQITVSQDSKQFPKPGYCKVIENETLLFQLYFDGGSERKLQGKHILKSLCRVHAYWEFEVSPIS